MKRFDFSKEPFETLIAFQKMIFENQLKELHRLMGEHVDISGFDPLTGKCPSIPYRKRRHQVRASRIRARLSAQDDSAPQVIPDEVEIKLANLCDGSGGLLSPRSVEAYLDLMIAARTVEKKALLLAALHATPSQQSLAHFVQCGGLKVLKHWVKDASEAGKGELVSLCLEAVRDLPVTEEAVRQSEIGKAIKRLKKAKGGRQASTQVLQQVDQIVGQWTAMLSKHRGSRKLNRIISSPRRDPLRRDYTLEGGPTHVPRRQRFQSVTSPSAGGGSDSATSLNNSLRSASLTHLSVSESQPRHRVAKRPVSILSTRKDKQSTSRRREGDLLGTLLSSGKPGEKGQIDQKQGTGKEKGSKFASNNSQVSEQELERMARDDRKMRRRHGVGGGIRMVPNPIPLIERNLSRDDSEEPPIPMVECSPDKGLNSDKMDCVDGYEETKLSSLRSRSRSRETMAALSSDPFNALDPLDPANKPIEEIENSHNIEANLPVIESFSTKGIAQKKKSTKRIRWADREGKELRQVHLFVTEEFEERGQEQRVSLIGMPEDLNREDTQLLLEDLAKRERELEREMLKKEREVAAKLRADELEQQRIALQRMAPNRKWVRPNKLALPEELEPAVNLESKELKQQHLRTKRLMEMHYISAQDVPPSPAEPPEGAQSPASGHAKTIPLEDVAEGPNKREEGEFVPGPGPGPESSPKNSQPSFTGLGRGAQIQSTGPPGPPGPPPGPPPHHPLPGAAVGPGQRNVDQLPAALKNLDPSVLRILVENEHLVRNLMQEDGSLNEEALVQLVTSLQPPSAQGQGQVSQKHPLQSSGSQPIIQQPGMVGPPPPPPPPRPLNQSSGPSPRPMQGASVLHQPPIPPMHQPMPPGPTMVPQQQGPQPIIMPGNQPPMPMHSIQPFRPPPHPGMIVMNQGMPLPPSGPHPMNGPSTFSRNRMCNYFNTSRGCAKGDRCSYIHDMNYVPDPRAAQNNRR